MHPKKPPGRGVVDKNVDTDRSPRNPVPQNAVRCSVGICVGPGGVHKNAPKKTFRPWGVGQKCRYGSGPLWTLRCCDTNTVHSSSYRLLSRACWGTQKCAPKKHPCLGVVDKNVDTDRAPVGRLVRQVCLWGPFRCTQKCATKHIQAWRDGQKCRCGSGRCWTLKCCVV